ncbi:MAG: type I-C CRISPR-associated protein Cas7/Csd2 [Alicyclobacillus sp.]|nr:type I-C CRISPR-associated protein Cas7/Csd2 [Alicyclobacillus sp.]
MSSIYDPNRRHDFLFAVEYINSLPNGDPDAGNAPRVDPETMRGLVTDVAVKRKIRDYVLMAQEEFQKAHPPTDEDRNEYNIYVTQGTYLSHKQRKAYENLGIEFQKDPSLSIVNQVRNEMVRLFFDVRMFGAVMTTGKDKHDGKDVKFNAGQVRGPVQIGFGMSVDPIFPLEIGITRVALTSPDEKEESDEEGGTTRTMGRKNIIPYGLYIFKGHYNPHLGRNLGVTERDMMMFWMALEKAWEFDVSSARGEVNLRDIHVFTHQSPLGNARAHQLFDRIRYEKKPEVREPRQFSDYNVTVDLDGLPEEITYTHL